MKFIYGKNSWRTHKEGEATCYLLTNGLGGFSSLTVTGANARNDHALLMASLKAPTVRYHLVTNVHGKVIVNDREYALSSQRYVNRTKNQQGFRWLQSFSFEYLPVWQYKIEDIDIVQTVFMKQGENTVGVKYEILAGSEATLCLTPWLQFVPKGQCLSKAQSFEMDETKIMSNDVTLYYRTNGCVRMQETVYSEDWYYDQDARDGRDAVGCSAANHQIICDVKPGYQSFYIVYSTKELADVDIHWVNDCIQSEVMYQKKLMDTAGLKDSVARLLSKSANQYLTWRESTNSLSVIAGYPFFGDWGRDTMIAMVGCTIATRQFDSAKSILRTFMAYCKKGLMPNMFPENDAAPIYNTVDAALLFIEVVYLYMKASGDEAFVREAWDKMTDIIRWYENGTDYQIHMDVDGLIEAGEGFNQLTWMDVRVGDILPTPRHGKPVEINAYWYNALMIMAELAPEMGAADSREKYQRMAECAKKSFIEKFWNEKAGCLKDVISGTSADTQIRCNQIWALTLSYVMLDEKQARSVIATVYKHLYTPWGLRSLSPEDVEYHPNYGGSQFERDMAYHQGTVWGYPLGAYYLAYLRWMPDRKTAIQTVKRQLAVMEAALREGCIGHIAEIYDGDLPDTSRGCFAQAWSVGEILRVYAKIEEMEKEFCIYEGKDLGAVYHKAYTDFKVWAPTADAVILNLYHTGHSEACDVSGTCDEKAQYPLLKSEKGTWQVRVTGDLEGRYYTYTVTVNGKTEETGDPYARACGVNGYRSMVVDLPGTDPEGWDRDHRKAGIEKHPVIYELHIKDFSNDVHSGISEKYRGKYMAFTEQETSLDGEGKFPTCMAYLKQLGVTYVHLLPCYDYGSVDEAHPEKAQFNWGYDPVNYNVPEGSYATDAKDGHVRIREFKEMVKALHEAGMGVILDVVFNHTYDLNVPLQKMVPGYYYRMYEDGTWSNGSGCGNDTASEREMFRQYMADSVCYWATEYHVDGFRFDLMGLHDIDTMNLIRERLDALPDGRNILMYGEPWSASETAWENGAIGANKSNVGLLDERIGFFCDCTRDAIKGDVFIEKEPGYVNGSPKQACSLKADIWSAVCAWCGQGRNAEKLNPKSPAQIINYISAHDDLTLWDKLLLTLKDKPDYEAWDDAILQINKMAAGIIMTCIGTPFFQAGEEFARTKSGSNNSYNLSPELNELKWTRAKNYSELVDYYRFLIALRKELPLLDRKDEAAVGQIRLIDSEDAGIGFVLEDASAEGMWQRALIYYHPFESEKRVDLPVGNWQLLSNGVDIHRMDGIKGTEKTVILQPKSVTIFGEYKNH